jgi:hypothetical protein
VKPMSYQPSMLVLLVLLVQSLVAADVRAQQPVEPPEYRGVVREALSEYQARNFNEARALFNEAHQLYPNARTLRGLGMAAFELRSYRESISFLDAALASKVKPLEGSLRAETERLRERAERFVGKLYLTLSPATTQVVVDGTPTEVTAGQPLLLEVGEHELEFRAESHQPETRALSIKGRDVETLSITLNEVPAPEVASAPTPLETARSVEAPSRNPQPTWEAGQSERPTKKPLYKNPWLWTGVGVVVVAATVTAVLLATRETELGAINPGPNTPSGGVIRALESRP